MIVPIPLEFSWFVFWLAIGFFTFFICIRSVLDRDWRIRLDEYERYQKRRRPKVRRPQTPFERAFERFKKSEEEKELERRKQAKDDGGPEIFHYIGGIPKKKKKPKVRHSAAYIKKMRALSRDWNAVYYSGLVASVILVALYFA